MVKVNLDALRPWVAKRITELLTVEDDILIDMVRTTYAQSYW